MSVAPDWRALRKAAERVAKRAYAPYSKFHVGAALLADDGRVFSGCNVENASFGLTICAERNAVFAAVGGDVRAFVALVIVTSAQQPVAPCGACRQVLVEFRPDFPVRCYGLDGTVLETSSTALLPHAFVEEAFRAAQPKRRAARVKAQATRLSSRSRRRPS